MFCNEYNLCFDDKTKNNRYINRLIESLLKASNISYHSKDKYFSEKIFL